MKKFVITGLFILAVCAVSTMAAETTVHGRLYSHWMMDMSDGAESYNDFGLSRAYVTVKSKLSDYTSVRITSDIRNAGGFSGYTIILKYAYMDWKPKFANDMVNLRFGLPDARYLGKTLYRFQYHRRSRHADYLRSWSDRHGQSRTRQENRPDRVRTNEWHQF